MDEDDLPWSAVETSVVQSTVIGVSMSGERAQGTDGTSSWADDANLFYFSV